MNKPNKNITHNKKQSYIMFTTRNKNDNNKNDNNNNFNYIYIHM